MNGVYCFVDLVFVRRFCQRLEQLNYSFPEVSAEPLAMIAA